MIFLGSDYRKIGVLLTFLLLCVLIYGGSVVGSGRASDQTMPPPEGTQPLDLEKAPTGMYDRWHQPIGRNNLSPLVEAQSDRFGYQMQANLPLTWIDATSGTEVFLEGEEDRDDNFTGPIPLGFTFDFYEHEYSQVYIGTNGILTFGEGSDSFANQLLPADPPPNDLVAAFWDDLEIGDGKVFYKKRNTPQGRTFIVEWNNVVRYSSSQPMTFQVILFQTGDILLQYKDVNGIITSATVGIEDGDGIDGITYLFNSTGLTAGKGIRFTRPGSAPRVKVLPLYQSGFTSSGLVRFEARIRNTSDTGTDVIDLQSKFNSPGWQAKVFGPDGDSPLTDTDLDGKIDTGSLGFGETKTIFIDVTAPATGLIGDYSLGELRVISSDDPAKVARMSFQAAIPSDFAQGYADSQSGLYMNLIWKEKVTASKTGSFFTGNTLSVTDINENGYFFAWERNGQTDQDQGTAYFSDIEFIVLDDRGAEVTGITKLTHNEELATPTLLVNARYPALAHAPNGHIGVIWAHYELDLNTIQAHSDIYFAILSSGGELVLGPENITNNSAWYSVANSGSPSFNNPRLVATSDNRFLLTWIDVRLDGSGETSAVYTAAYTAAGGAVAAPQPLATSQPGKTLFMDPALADLSGGRAFLAYSVFDQDAKTYTVAYTVLKSNATKLRGIKNIAGSSGWRSDAIQLENGNVLLAWTNPESGQLARTVFDNSGSTSLLPPTDLPLVGARLPDYVSLTRTRNGNAILTWMDAEWKDYLYYTLLDPSGLEITPPMIFMKGLADNPLIQTSFSGQGVAVFEGKYENFMPAVLENQ